MNQFIYTLRITATLLFLGTATLLVAQRKDKTKTPIPNNDTAKVLFQESLYNGLEWRCIGPFRGGRSAAVTGVAGKPQLFYMGATGGGLGAQPMADKAGTTSPMAFLVALSAQWP